MSDSENPSDAAGEDVKSEEQSSFEMSPEPPREHPADSSPVPKTRKRPENKSPCANVQGLPETLKSDQDSHKGTSEAVAQGGWGYWGSWGKSLLSTATATVTTVGQGISHVIEKAETSLGIPSPEDLSACVEEEEKTDGEAREGESDRAGADGASAMGSAMGMLTSLSSVVQSTGKTVITGGLDALEFIGKKTMDVIAEGDPGFKKTKGLMIRTTTLSQVLREAKEREEQQTAEKLTSDSEKKAHYGMLFDEFQGLSHLEALEILSRESDAKVKSVLSTITGEPLIQLKEELELIKEPFSLVDFDDDDVDETKEDDAGTEFTKELTDTLSQLRISVTMDKLSQVVKNVHNHMADMKKSDVPALEKEEGREDNVMSKYNAEDVHSAAIRSLAEITARAIEQFHKVAEIVLLCSSKEAAAEEQAKVLAHITVMLCKEISLLSKRFTTCLTTIGSSEKGEVLNPLITGVFLEASNSASYIQDAFQLLMPVMEVSHIQRTSDPTQ
ncbi:protein FAM114A2 [Denticeps clupeoides]|uniref:Protein FAM114A2 n=1 Tax=Denticeps clupeoides TaxID=299321 RepID=A0AAY4EB25_9TELE|nr:protein FAM114A2 [Denticeps clupeoides]